MIFSEAVAEVTSIVKRPDKATEIASNINKAISFFVLKGEFAKDLAEQSMPIDSTLLGQTIDLSTVTPAIVRFRKFKYIRPRSQRYYITEIESNQVFTPSGIIQPNRYFIAGSNLTFTLSVPDSFLEVGYFQYPSILTPVTGSDTHWLLDMIPWAVIEWAASQVFQSIGDETSARYYQASAMGMYQTMKMDYMQP